MSAPQLRDKKVLGGYSPWRRFRALAVAALLTLAVSFTAGVMAPCAVAQAEEQASDTTAANTIAAAQSLADSSSKANHWQVVSGEYAGNVSGNKQEEFKNSDRTKSGVRAQKNVVATDVENEFLIYESIDVKQRFADYFASAEYMATTSNNYHGQDLGTVVSSMTGNMKVQVTGQSDVYSNSGNFTILSSNRELLAENITLYWSQANNVTFFLKIDNTHYVLLGVKVRNGSDNTVMLSDEAEELIMSKVAQYANLTSVVDEMGPNIEYLETVACDGSTSYASGEKTLTWTPTPKANPTIEKTRTNESKTVTFTDHEGKVRTETVYKYDSWATNVCELVYKVRLTPAVSTGLSKGGNQLPAISQDAAESTPTNGTATVNWDGGSGNLTSPVVRGMKYELKLKKVDEKGQPLAGATFTLYGDSAHTKAVATATSDKNGIIDFTNLQYNYANGGNYDVVETGAPAGYIADPDNTTAGTTYKLCYTDSKSCESLTGQNTETASNEEALVDTSTTKHFANKLVKYRVQVKKVDASDNTKVLQGAKFELFGTDIKTETKTSDEYGMAIFTTDLKTGDYYIKETKAPKGYQLDNTPRSLSITMGADGTPSVAISGQNARVTVSGLQDGVYTITVTVADRFSVPLRVIKYAAGKDGQADKAKPLAGAQFALYTDANCTKLAAGLYSDAALSLSVTGAQTTADNGVLTWYGLSAGTYYLKETFAPAGYKLYEKTIQIQVDANGNVSASVDINGNGKIDDGETSALNKQDGIPYIELADDKVPVLPTAGTFGHLLLSIFGVGFIVAGCAIVAGTVLRHRHDDTTR